MFDHDYQGGPYFEVLSSQTSPKNWKLSRGSVKKLYSPEIKSYCFHSDNGKLCLGSEKLHPFLIQPFLLLQMQISHQGSVSLEFSVSDMSNQNRRFFISTSIREIKVTALHASLPFPSLAKPVAETTLPAGLRPFQKPSPAQEWHNLCFDLPHLLASNFKGCTFKSLGSISVHGTFKLRKICTLKSRPSTRQDEMNPALAFKQLTPLPRILELPSHIHQTTIVVGMDKIENTRILAKPLPPAARPSQPNVAFGRTKLSSRPLEKMGSPSPVQLESARLAATPKPAQTAGAEPKTGSSPRVGPSTPGALRHSRPSSVLLKTARSNESIKQTSVDAVSDDGSSKLVEMIRKAQASPEIIAVDSQPSERLSPISALEQEYAAFLQKSKDNSMLHPLGPSGSSPADREQDTEIPEVIVQQMKWEDETLSNIEATRPLPDDASHTTAVQTLLQPRLVSSASGPTEDSDEQESIPDIQECLPEEPADEPATRSAEQALRTFQSTHPAVADGKLHLAAPKHSAQIGSFKPRLEKRVRPSSPSRRTIAPAAERGVTSIRPSLEEEGITSWGTSEVFSHAMTAYVSEAERQMESDEEAMDVAATDREEMDKEELPQMDEQRNGQKVTVLLEELCLAKGLEYDAYNIAIMNQEQFTTGFTELNPNQKIPVLADWEGKTDKPLRVFESVSILIYLADKYKAFIPQDFERRTECLNWLIWQVGTAPYIGGGFGHFYKYAPIKIEYAIDRFSMEVKRIIDVLDRHLEGKTYIMGEEYTIADMANFPWIRTVDVGYNAKEFLDLASYKNVNRWLQTLLQREGVKRGLRVNGLGANPIKERHSSSQFTEDSKSNL
ncbi:hypothetical protein HDU91_006268 [Kappamyces sp. JEL0680]|nr:hypothetical protein HDU91_006268 [Kappamyces sp. JEL0680]